MAINLFQLSANDQSIYYLGQIFGSVGGVLPAGTLGQSQIPIMSQLFLTLNTIGLAIGAIVVVYTTVVGIMMTAHEGEFLGKKWSGLWVPIRMVLGTACLFPAASGYSIMQIIVMWFVVQGVGAADMVWSAVVKGSQGVPVEATSLKSNASTLSTQMLVSDIFKGLVCQNTMLGAKTSLQGMEGIKVDKRYKQDAFDPNAAAYNMGPKGACGRLVMCKSCSQNTIGCKVCAAQRDALQQIIPTLDKVAERIAAADIGYIKFYNTPGGKDPAKWITNYCSENNIQNCCVKPEQGPLGNPTGVCNADAFVTYIDPDAPSAADMSGEELDFVFDWAMPEIFGEADPEKWGSFIDATVYQYNTVVQAAIDEGAPPAEPAPADEKEKYGWITAGIYYYDIIKTTQNSLKEASTSSQVIDPSGGILPGSNIKNYRNNYNSAQDLLDKIAGITSSDSEGSIQTPKAPTKAARISDAMNNGSSIMMRDFMNNLTENKSLDLKGTKGNAFTNVAVFGQNLLIIAQIMYAITLVVFSVGAAVMAYFSTTILGTGTPTSWGSELIKGFFSVFGPTFFALLSALFTFGALLGMYVPMIPYVVFTVTVIGWFIAVIEAMVAGPVMAIGLLSPGGQSEVFGRAEPSVMIVFNIFLRPSLMVTGLVTAMFLANVVITFINFGFVHIMGAVMNIKYPGMVENVIFIAIYVSLIFTSMNQVFTLIHHIPERILTYLSGGQAMAYGEAQAAQATKQAVEGAAGGMAGGMKGGAEGAIGHGEGFGREMKVSGSEAGQIALNKEKNKS